MTSGKHIDCDKSGEALKEQRFHMLEDIARELAGDVVFPTNFDAVVALRKILQAPQLTIQDLTQALALEPLISAKLIHRANLDAGTDQNIVDLQTAIKALGLKTARSCAMSIVMAQLLGARGMAGLSEMADALWEHSIRAAAAARVIAANCTRINPDEAMLAGMIHDLGGFYMLYRAAQYEELLQRPESIRFLMIDWHESIGIALLKALGLPEEIISATEDHDHPRPPPLPPRSLRDIVYIANLLAGRHCESPLQDERQCTRDIEFFETAFAHLKPEIDALVQEMRSCFS